MRYIYKAGIIPSLFAMIQNIVKSHKILRRLRITQELFVAYITISRGCCPQHPTFHATSILHKP
jgi:hypothetical protein